MIDVRQLVNLLVGPAHFHGVADVIQAALAGDGELAAEFVCGNGPIVIGGFALSGFVVRCVRGIARRATCRICPGRNRIA